MNASRNSLLMTFALAAATLVPDAAAQSAAPWNRKAQSVALVPSESGLPGHFDISVVWTVVLGQPASTPLKLDADVAFEIDGVEVFRLVEKVQANALSGNCGSCAPGCGTGATNGMSAALLCISEGVAGCSCQFPPITTTLPDVPLVPGDEITVILYPAPGALPEFVLSDDIGREVFKGSPIYWERHAQVASLKPSVAGPQGSYDVIVEWGASTAGGTDTRIITPEFAVYVNGYEDFVYQSPCGPWIIAPNNDCYTCTGQICGSITCNGVVQSVTTCQEDAQGVYCVCLSSTSCQVIIPGVVLLPGDELTVILRPAPGALPELPQFDDDDLVITSLPYNPWKNLDKALAGVSGKPALTGTGTLEAGTPITLALSNAKPNAPAWLVAGPFVLFAPFKGGVLVPSPAPPALLLPLVTNATGMLILTGAWPAGIPAGFSLYFQWWIADVAGPKGYAASNAISGTTKP